MQKTSNSKKISTFEKYTKHLKREKIHLRIAAKLSIFLFSLIFVLHFIGEVGTAKNFEYIDTITPVGAEITPTIDDETGYWTFASERDFKILQLTDIHLGGGAFSLRKDRLAIDAVTTLVKRIKPDLIVVTGDISYPFPVQSGTVDNLRTAELFAKLMQKLGVWWAPIFGNHDSEVYSQYSREKVAKFYAENKYGYCLFQNGPNEIDGNGNYVINIKNGQIITHSLFMLDSHSYVKGSMTGLGWRYDNLHQNQVDWYESEVKNLNQLNENNGGEKIKSTMYIHIPLTEYKDAWTEYVDNDRQNTDNVQFFFGNVREKLNAICCGVGNDNMFEKILELKSTLGVFCGHDHYNDFSLNYKGVKLTYGKSIDYLAYFGIDKNTFQRGGTVVTVFQNGKIDVKHEKLDNESKN